MDTSSPTTKSPGPHTAAAPPEPRSKLEYMFRAMLVEGDEIISRSEQLVKLLNTAAMQLQTLPAAVRKAGSIVQDQAASRAIVKIQEATSQVDDARRQLKRASEALDVQRGRNLWAVGIVALGSGLAGGLVAAVVMLIALR
ncbi:hypothetical protein [Bordetella sp. FB-8]|uniref:hypothetical protein n=1 Tax=Bordetella sp. FB-8 TaxID=1159870 RepID=UPI000361E2F1|nr:hypothetical protein [Bordetella sp. FB-8]